MTDISHFINRVESILLDQDGSISEYALIKLLDRHTVFDTCFKQANTQNANERLFIKHFMLMHALYLSLIHI